MKTTLCLLSGVLFVAVFSMAQSEHGAIAGSIHLEGGSPLAGATVVAEGKYLLGNRTSVSDQNGHFSLRNLPVGPYAIAVTMDGFDTEKFAGIQVAVSEVLNLPVMLRVTDVHQVITVTRAAALSDPTTANLGGTFHQQILKNLPTTKDPWSVIEATPGVDMEQINVGGNKQNRQPGFSAYGSSRYQTAYFMDGVNITGGIGYSIEGYDYDSFSQIKVSTCGHDASIGSPGVNVLMVTKSGSNEFDGRLSYGYSSDSLQSSNAEILQDGNVLETPQDSINERTFSLGGPIIKDRLWFFAALHNNDVDLFVPNTEKSSHDITDLEVLNTNLLWRISENHTLKLAYNGFEKAEDNRLPRPRSFHTQPGTGWAERFTGNTWYLMDEWVLNDSTLLSFKYGRQDGHQSFAPSADAPEDLLTRHPRHINLATGTATAAPYYSEIFVDAPTFTGEAFFLRNFADFSHDIRAGVDYRVSSFDIADSFAGDALVIQYNSSEGFVRFIRPFTLVNEVESTNLYVNDVITRGHWTFNVGLRYQLQSGSIKGGTVDGTWQHVPEEVAPGFASRFGTLHADPIHDATKWTDLVPRINVTYDLNTDGRTLFKAGFNRYAWTLNDADNFVVASPLATYVEQYGWTDRDGNELFLGNGSDWDEIDFEHMQSTSGPGTGTPIAENFSAPTVDEVILNVSHQFFNDWSLSANLIYRKTSNLTYEMDSGAAGLHHWTQNTLTDVNGNSHTVYDWAGEAYTPNVWLQNLDGFKSEYTGCELTTKNIGPRHRFLASMTFGSRNETYDISHINNPNEAWNFTRSWNGLGTYAPEWSVRGFGSVDLPFGIVVGTKFRYSSGRYYASYQNYSTARGESAILINGVEIEHLPAYFLLDLAVTKSFKLSHVANLELRLDAFNTLNEDAVISYDSYDVEQSNYLKPTEIIGPRVMKITAAIVF